MRLVAGFAFLGAKVENPCLRLTSKCHVGIGCNENDPKEACKQGRRTQFRQGQADFVPERDRARSHEQQRNGRSPARPGPALRVGAHQSLQAHVTA